MRSAVLTFVFLFALPSAAMAQTITVTSPKGGENWALGSTHAITWTSSGVTGEVNILLLNSSGRAGIIRENVPVTQGAVDWVVGEVQGGTVGAGSGYLVRIRKPHTEISGTSAGSFSIQSGSRPPESLQIKGTVKIPPRLLSFTVNDGEDVTTDMHVRFPFRAVGGASHYRYRINPGWEEWQPLAPGREASGFLLLQPCDQLVYFQVRNEFGESNVMSDGITYRYSKNTTIAASVASDYCAGNGWTFTITKKDCNLCAYLLPYPLDGVIACEIDSLRAHADPLPQGHKCEFELFGGRQLKEGWEFVSYELVPPQGIGAGKENGYAILQQPSPGARDITLKVRLWHDILRYLDGISFTVRSITLKGPCDIPVSEAFQ